MKYSLASMLFLMSLIAAPASAHHSLAAYEISGYRTIEGTVKEFFWGSPHTSLVLIAEGAPGEIKEWTFEGGSPGRLGRGGFSENIIVPDDKITVSYHRNRDDTIGGFFLASQHQTERYIVCPAFADAMSSRTLRHRLSQNRQRKTVHSNPMVKTVVRI